MPYFQTLTTEVKALFLITVFIACSRSGCCGSGFEGSQQVCSREPSRITSIAQELELSSSLPSSRADVASSANERRSREVSAPSGFRVAAPFLLLTSLGCNDGTSRRALTSRIPTRSSWVQSGSSPGQHQWQGRQKPFPVARGNVHSKRSRCCGPDVNQCWELAIKPLLR